MIKQSITQTNKQSISQSVNRSINQSINLRTFRSAAGCVQGALGSCLLLLWVHKAIIDDWASMAVCSWQCSDLFQLLGLTSGDGKKEGLTVVLQANEGAAHSTSQAGLVSVMHGLSSP